MSLPLLLTLSRRCLPALAILVLAAPGCIEGKSPASDGGGADTGTQTSDGPQTGRDTGKPGPDRGGPTPDRGGKTPDGGAQIPGKFVTFAKGTFEMGAPANEPCARTYQETRHTVTLSRAFELMTTEVTQGQFQAVMGYNPSKFILVNSSKGAYCGSSDCSQNPVEQLYWHEAAAYCNALSDRAGLTRCYDCSGQREKVKCSASGLFSGPSKTIHACPGYRLPTDAEWEYAYRAGTKTAYYNGANDPTRCRECDDGDLDSAAHAIAWYCANAKTGGGNQATHPVGKGKQPNARGLYDMAGNVREWCDDWHTDDLGTAAVTDPWYTQNTGQKVARGGGYTQGPTYLRAASREGQSITYHISNIGFRVARTLP